MFTEMGWLDSSYNFNNVTAEADVMSLPANVNINNNLQTVYQVESVNWTTTNGTRITILG